MSGQIISYTVTNRTIDPAVEPVIKLVFAGVTNPRTLQQTGKFLIRTFDSKGNQIDQGFEVSTKMTKMNEIESISVVSGSDVNGNWTDYTFSMSSKFKLMPGDKVSYQFPPGIKPPQSKNAVCLPAGTNVQSVNCTVSGDRITVTLLQFKREIGVFDWVVSGVRNPISTKPSNGFTNVQIRDKDEFGVIYFPTDTNSILTSTEGTITKAFITQGSYDSLVKNSYQLVFYPYNPIPQTGAIQIQYPSQIGISANGTDCIVVTNKALNNTCTIDETARTILIKGAFGDADSEGYSSNVTIYLNDVRNPETNKDEKNGFGIRTYLDDSLRYNIDKLSNDVLVPALDCTFPCRTCSKDDPNVCTSCWLFTQDEVTSQFYVRKSDLGGVCLDSCPAGMTSDGNPQKVCVQCDPSCQTCYDWGEIGDRKRCIECSPDFPYR